MPLLPEKLLYEILTQDPSKTPWENWRPYAEKLHGTHFRASQTVEELRSKEVKRGRRTRIIIDTKASKRMLRFVNAVSPDPDVQWEFTEEAKKEQKRLAETIPAGYRKSFQNIIKTRDWQDDIAEIRTIKKRCRNFEEAFFKHLDQHDGYLQSLLMKVDKQPKAHCGYTPRRGWISFELLRLQLCQVYRWLYDGIKEGRDIKTKKIENAHMDITYLAMLPFADGIVSADKGLTEVARAAFPKAKVWNDLDQCI